MHYAETGKLYKTTKGELNLGKKRILKALTSTALACVLTASSLVGVFAAQGTRTVERSTVMVNAVKVFTLRLCISAYYIHFKRVKVKIFTAFTIICTA